MNIKILKIGLFLIYFLWKKKSILWIEEYAK